MRPLTRGSLGHRTAFIGITTALVAVALTGWPGSSKAADGTSSATASNDPPTTSIRWLPCSTNQTLPGLRCATIKVPVDWDEPDGATFDLAINRLPASDQKHRQGVLVVNPGGPGGSGLDSVAGNMFFSSPELRDVPKQYDIIGFDPRGIGKSSALRCDTPLAVPGVDIHPTTRAQLSALRQANQRIGESCRSKSGPIIDHVDSASAARDVDVVRRALGEQTVNWFAISYGTELAQEYALRFGPHVGRMALDGLVDHTQSATTAILAEAAMEERGWEAFASWCAGSADCALHGQDVSAVLDQVLATADRRPIVNSSTGKPTDGTDIMSGVYGFLLGHDNWPSLASGLRKAAGQDAPADTAALNAGPGGTRVDPSYRYIWCEDMAAGYTDAEQARSLVKQLKRVAPHTWRYSEAADIYSGCTGLPVTKGNPPQSRPIEVPNPVLLVSNERDPSTTIEWGRLVQSRIAGSHLLTADTTGHTALFNSGCGRSAISRYLLTGALPSQPCPE